MDRLEGQYDADVLVAQEVAETSFAGVDALEAETHDLLSALGIDVDFDGNDYPELD